MDRVSFWAVAFWFLFVPVQVVMVVDWGEDAVFDGGRVRSLQTCLQLGRFKSRRMPTWYILQLVCRMLAKRGRVRR